MFDTQPGNSTLILARRLPGAEAAARLVTGDALSVVDDQFSEATIARARQERPSQILIECDTEDVSWLSAALDTARSIAQPGTAIRLVVAADSSPREFEQTVVDAFRGWTVTGVAIDGDTTSLTVAPTSNAVDGAATAESIQGAFLIESALKTIIDPESSDLDELEYRSSLLMSYLRQIPRLHGEIKALNAELQASRQAERNLRSQLQDDGDTPSLVSEVKPSVQSSPTSPLTGGGDRQRVRLWKQAMLAGSAALWVAFAVTVSNVWNLGGIGFLLLLVLGSVLGLALDIRRRAKRLLSVARQGAAGAKAIRRLESTLDRHRHQANRAVSDIVTKQAKASQRHSSQIGTQLSRAIASSARETVDEVNHALLSSARDTVSEIVRAVETSNEANLAELNNVIPRSWDPRVLVRAELLTSYGESVGVSAGPPAGRQPDAHDYIARPYVCGILGSVPSEITTRLLEVSPHVGLVNTPRLDGRIWRTGGGRWDGEGTYDWVSGESHAGAWIDLANRDRPGISLDANGVRLFAGATGIDSIYVRIIGKGVVFSSEPDPLIELADVTTNWDAWVDILTFGYPLGSATTVDEVFRLEPASSLILGPQGWHIRQYNAYWEEVEPVDVSPAEVIDRLHAAMPPIDATPALTLSGGWDSRLLAGLLHNTTPFVDAYTIATDDGFEQDLELAGPVASSLGFPHFKRDQPDNLGPVENRYHSRVFFETWFHTWMESLAIELRADRRQVFDGLGGDVLFKNHMVSSECAFERDAERQMDLVWDALIAGAALSNSNIWNPRFQMVAQGTRPRFGKCTERFVGHPAAPTLAVLLNRTVRGIAPSPLWLFGPECDVQMPFAHRSVIEAALAVPLTLKDQGSFYRELLEEAAPQVARLPSTNDTAKPAARPRKSLSHRNIASYAGLIARSPDAMRLLPSVLAELLTDPAALAVDPRRGGWVRILKGASMLSAWQRRWAHRLRDIGQAPW